LFAFGGETKEQDADGGARLMNETDADADRSQTRPPPASEHATPPRFSDGRARSAGAPKRPQAAHPR
jgi:hypothetical protein